MPIFLIPDKSKRNPDIPEGTPENPNYKVFTIANVITFLRLILTIVFFYLFVTDANRYIALIIYAVAASTDWLDGKIARATQTVSWYGKILDPICDRFLIFTGVVALAYKGELPLWIPILLIGRDVYLAAGSKYLQKFRERPVDVVFIGKVTTALLLVGFTWMLLGFPVLNGFDLTQISWLPLLNNESACMGILIVYLGCICSVITALVYTFEGLSIIHESRKNSSKWR